jgi:hypothetical protein
MVTCILTGKIVVVAYGINTTFLGISNPFIVILKWEFWQDIGSAPIVQQVALVLVE